jgi:hypothetical protein
MPESYLSRWAPAPSRPVIDDDLAEAIRAAIYVLKGNDCHGTSKRLQDAFSKATGESRGDSQGSGVG